ncbi:MAG: hypothetical protein VX910_05405 [Candidatus Latescibacterota bacterium]|nr:hypothetical protein [Candidatus Latescibacterota bacterium]
MTLTELTTRYPKIPVELHAEPVLQAFVDTFGSYLQTATKPSACSTDRIPENNAYMTLIAPIDIYGYGLSSRERVLEQLAELISRYEVSVDDFEADMFGTLSN